MKKLTLLVSSLLLLTTFKALAQMPYTVTTLNQAYQPLTGTTSINGTTIWDDDAFTVALPFNFKIGGTAVTSLNLDLATGTIATTGAGSSSISGITYGEMDLIDKGALTNATTISPIRYVLTGTAPNRILKAEISNAGFYDEVNDNMTANDNVNIQIWLYETSQVVELHYGPSSISTTDYFIFGNGPGIGYVKNYDFDNETIDNYYTLAGNATNPTLDSLDFVAGTGSVLNTYPPSGTVYRFTPKVATGIGQVAALSGVTVYPTMTNELIHVTLKDHATAQYQVIGMDGRKTGISGTLRTGNTDVAVGALPQGLYLIEVTQDHQRAIHRFTKN